MDKLVVEGGIKLYGEVEISGAKNSVLPIISATILLEDDVIIHNVPDLEDVRVMKKLLEILGKEIKFSNGTMVIKSKTEEPYEAPYEIVKKIRASIAVLGPLLAKRRRARVSFPGGCAIGPRPVDLHIKGMRILGASVKVEHGYIVAETDGLTGGFVNMLGINGTSVVATENVMMAATLARGTTVIDNAAMEPEVVDLANFLIKCGAKIKGHGTNTIVVEGVKKLKGCEYTVIPDRIEAGTYILAGMMTGGEVLLRNVEPSHLTEPINVFRQMGARIETTKDTILVKGIDRYEPVNVVTLPYPLFPTDLQAQLMAVLTKSRGISVITERIFQNRFAHAAEMNRMGADITIENASAIIRGVEKLYSATVMASDLRGGAGLIIALLGAEGKGELLRLYHVDRGYERIEEKLSKLGAKVSREKADLI
ncbi:MAG: UDP-N-acetylglucosamine 1-carboxyvinyltransferase [Brevinematales bacterium]|nr:UDP-N-acetylglucosamine 1-carboxyvinyltransferase [Brevinematales bacterium]